MANKGKNAEFHLFLREFLTRQGAVLEARRQAVLASDDPEGIHQLRVSTRRLRSVLLTLGYKQTKLQKNASKLAAELGKVRDLDVLREKHGAATHTHDTGSLDYAQHLETTWRTQRAELKKQLCGKRWHTFLNALADFRAALQSFGMTNREAAAAFIGAELKRTKSKGRQIRQYTPDAELHKLRIQCKRLRYVVEMFDSLDGIDLDGFKNHAGDLQQLLGLFNDERIAVKSLQQYGQHLPLAEANRQKLIEIGRQVNVHERNIAMLRGNFSGAWNKFDASCTRKALRRALRD